MKTLLLFTLCLLVHAVSAQPGYRPDSFIPGFEKATIAQPDDYEGLVDCTIIRKQDQPENRKAVLYIHGFNDYFFQEEMANWYTSHGFRFYAVDLRKYGRSLLPNQKMNNVRDLREYFADIDTVLRIIREEGADSVLINGHSTGGLIATYYAQEHPHSELFDALFLNSPFFDFNEPWLLKKLGVPMIAKKGLKHPDKLKKGGFTKWYGYSIHTSEHGEWDYDLRLKPHVAPPVNYGWVRAIHMAQLVVQSGKEITVPLLVICSMKSVYPKKWSAKLFTGDAILDVKDIRRVSEQLNDSNKTIISISGLLHDVVLSPQPARNRMYTGLGEWLDQQF